MMLYTEDFNMLHYVGFSQIGSHISYYAAIVLDVFSDQLCWHNRCVPVSNYNIAKYIIQCLYVIMYM